jgi:hypothetical protein
MGGSKLAIWRIAVWKIVAARCSFLGPLAAVVVVGGDLVWSCVVVARPSLWLVSSWVPLVAFRWVLGLVDSLGRRLKFLHA